MSYKTDEIGSEKYFDNTNYTYNERIQSVILDNELQLGMLEAYGEDLKLIKKVLERSPKNVWSVINGDDDKVHVKAGFEDGDCIYYIVTNEEYVDEKETYFLGGE